MKSPLSLLEHEVLFFCFVLFMMRTHFSFNSLTLPSGISHLLVYQYLMSCLSIKLSNTPSLSQNPTKDTLVLFTV